MSDSGHVVLCKNFQWEWEKSNLQVLITRLVYSQLASPVAALPETKKATEGVSLGGFWSRYFGLPSFRSPLGSFALAWRWYGRSLAVSKLTTVPRHDAINPLRHEHRLVPQRACVDVVDEEDIVVSWC